MFISKNGFLITDVYKDLKSSLASHDYERSCYWSVELIVSGEAKPMIHWLIALIATDYITTNGFLYEFVYNKIAYIYSEKYKWKTSLAVKKTFAELVTILAKEEQTTTSFYKTTAGNFKTFIDSLHFYAPKEYRELKDNLPFFIGNEVFSLVSYLYEFMLNGDTKNVFKILYFISSKGVLHECETIDIVADIKKNKNDSVWLLWKVLFIFIHRPPIDDMVIKYVTSLYNIFSFEYSKKVRIERINLLFVAYVVCVKRKAVSVYNLYDNLVATAGNQIHVLYEDALKNEIIQKQVEKEEKKVAKKRETVRKKTKSTSTPEQIKALEEKIKYFYVLTYKAPSQCQYAPTREPLSLANNALKVINVKQDTYSSSNDQSSGLAIEKI